MNLSPRRVLHYPIEYDIPAPKSITRGIWLEHLLAMEEGGSFLVPKEDYNNVKVVQANVHHSARSKDLKIKTRETNKGLRVWLVGKRN